MGLCTDIIDYRSLKPQNYKVGSFGINLHIQHVNVLIYLKNNNDSYSVYVIKPNMQPKYWKIKNTNRKSSPSVL
jgi:hypothetical protein